MQYYQMLIATEGIVTKSIVVGNNTLSFSYYLMDPHYADMEVSDLEEMMQNNARLLVNAVKNSASEFSAERLFYGFCAHRSEYMTIIQKRAYIRGYCPCMFA